ncbi:MAG TPA: hypothetical protein VE011_09750 [Candidatus Dormibacteraeota bacterium]|nr:hypothetical protein [Candidatus Dormibacteraeota bacterium]
MTTYADLANRAIPAASHRLVDGIIRAIALDLGLRAIPPVRWVVDLADRSLAPDIRLAIGQRRYPRQDPVLGWEADGAIYLVHPRADRSTLAHELRHVWQRATGRFAMQRLAAERDAETYARRMVGESGPWPRWIEDMEREEQLRASRARARELEQLSRERQLLQDAVRNAASKARTPARAAPVRRPVVLPATFPFAPPRGAVRFSGAGRPRLEFR